MDGWDHTDAKVACDDFGLSPYGAIALAYDTLEHRPVAVTDVHCRGDEINFSECSRKLITAVDDDSSMSGSGKETIQSDDAEYEVSSGSGRKGMTYQCRSNKIAGILCWKSFDHDICNMGDLRIESGRLEICINQRWSGICKQGWTNANSAVACRQLGYSSTNAKLMSFKNQRSVLMSQINCDRNSEHISECLYEYNSCPSGETIGLNCSNVESCTSGNVRLLASDMDDTGTIGIVQMCIDNQWNVICDHQWTTNEANVTCHQLGYSFKEALAFNFPMDSPGSPLNQLVRCKGTESTLSSCITDQKRHLSCSPTLYAAVKCTSKCTEGDILIKNVKYVSEVSIVYIQICSGDEWKALCDPDWNYQDASIACQSGGMSPYGAYILLIPHHTCICMQLTGAYPTFVSRNTYSVGHTWIQSEVHCKGEEKNLSQCKMTQTNQVGRSICSGKYISGAICLDKTDVVSHNCTTGNVRTANKNVLEICINGMWKSLCHNEEFKYKDGFELGRLACIRLGYGDQFSSPISSTFLTSLSPLHTFPRVSCPPNATNVLDCIQNYPVQPGNLNRTCITVAALDCIKLPSMVESVTPSEYSISYEEGVRNNVTFTCVVFGPVPFTINWYFQGEFYNYSKVLLKTLIVDNTLNEGRHMSMLTLNNVTSSNNGLYTCSSGRDGKDSSYKSAKLIVNVTPKLTFESSLNGQFLEGTPAAVTCTSVGYPMPILSILRNDKLLSWTNKSSCSIKMNLYECTLIIKFHQIKYSDRGIYTCSNIKIYKSIYIDVWSYPKIINELQDVTIKINRHEKHNVTFSCAVVGSPLPYLIWYRERHSSGVKEVIQPDENHEIVTMPSLTTLNTVESDLIITNAAPANTGRYYCNGINSIAMATCSASLIAYKNPSLRIRIGPSSRVLVNANVTITCTIGRINRLINYTLSWVRDDSVIIKRVHLTDPPVKAHAITLESVTVNDTGSYQCHLSYDYGDDVIAINHITVEDPLEINFSSNSPIVSGNNVQALITSNKPLASMTCTIGSVVKNCISGNVSFDNVVCNSPHPVILVVNATSHHLHEIVVTKRHLYIGKGLL
jgi:hypothetical protein